MRLGHEDYQRVYRAIALCGGCDITTELTRDHERIWFSTPGGGRAFVTLGRSKSCPRAIRNTIARIRRQCRGETS